MGAHMFLSTGPAMMLTGQWSTSCSMMLTSQLSIGLPIYLSHDCRCWSLSPDFSDASWFFTYCSYISAKTVAWENIKMSQGLNKEFDNISYYSSCWSSSPVFCQDALSSDHSDQSVIAPLLPSTPCCVISGGACSPTTWRKYWRKCAWNPQIPVVTLCTKM